MRTTLELTTLAVDAATQTVLVGDERGRVKILTQEAYNAAADAIRPERVMRTKAREVIIAREVELGPGDGWTKFRVVLNRYIGGPFDVWIAHLPDLWIVQA